MNEHGLLDLYRQRIDSTRNYIMQANSCDLSPSRLLEMLGYGPEGIDFAQANPVVDPDRRDFAITQLKGDNALLRSTLAWYVHIYERWEEAVSDILGRRPETGLHIQRAKECLDIVGWPPAKGKEAP